MTPAILILLLLISAAGVAGSEATRGMVATTHPLATDAAVRVLREGGNAVDAAVAAALTLGVVDTDNSGIGGGCFMLIHRADGSLVAIDGRETAPMAATPDMFIRSGKADTTLSQSGSLASGVPGALAAYEFAVMNHGTRKLADLLLPAADIAEKGFRLNARYARSLKHVAKDLARFESSRAVFFKNRQPLAEGDILKQPDLAATYRGIAAAGSDWFYRGPFAHAVQRWMKDNGGIITAEDLRNYQVCVREPLISRYREFRVIGFPPPSSGGIHVAQMLNLLETFNLKSLDEATRLHVIAEAMRLAFADRAYWLGDPDFVNVPRGLMDRNYATTLSRLISPDRAARVTSHGTPPDWETDFFRKHTTHFSVADAAGNWVACTATINTSFGSKVVIPGTGVVMNNQMDDFSIHPGVRNYFGLVGGRANAIAPGKRPLSSMTPTLVLKDQKPIIALGAAGGPKIISQVLLELVNLLDLQMSPKQALAQPRIHHQWSPDELTVEKALPRKLQAELARRGHKLKQLPSIGASQIVARSRDGKGLVGAADPRAGGKAAGW